MDFDQTCRDILFGKVQKRLDLRFEFIFRVPLKPVLRGMAGVVHFITGHKQTQ